MWQLALGVTVLALAGSVQGTAFSVGHGGYVARDGKIWFRNILEDTDGQWIQQRSHFQCRDPGYYFISFHGLSRRGTAVTLHLRKNYQEVLAAYGDGAGYNTASNSGIFYLNRQDIISLHVVEGRIHESSSPTRNYVTLSGFKIADGFSSQPRPWSPEVPYAGAVPDAVPAGGHRRPAGGHGGPAGGQGGPTVAADPQRGGEDGFVPLDAAAGGPN